MKTLFGTLAIAASLAILPLKSASRDQDKAPARPSPEASEPSTQAPAEPPPPPPAVLPAPPPGATPAPRQEKPADAGQWVHTEQYGWVWMPYGDRYTNLPPDGGTPHMYVYYPEAGWCWVVAPWLWGWGPMPYFGVWGPRYYGWYGVGLGHWYGYSGRYAYWGDRAYWHGGRWNGVDRSYDHGARGSYGRGGGFWGGGGHSRGLTPGWRR